jgi:hypothetical protein
MILISQLSMCRLVKGHKPQASGFMFTGGDSKLTAGSLKLVAVSKESKDNFNIKK